MNPLTSITGSIIVGVLIALAITFAILPNRIQRAHPRPLAAYSLGVMWIGLLYYFNVVQMPGLAVAAADKGGPGGAGVNKYIAPRALLWFRWARGRHLAHRLLVPRLPQALHERADARQRR